jgi:hypothetical protein
VRCRTPMYWQQSIGPGSWASGTSTPPRITGSVSPSAGSGPPSGAVLATSTSSRPRWDAFSSRPTASRDSTTADSSSRQRTGGYSTSAVMALTELVPRAGVGRDREAWPVPLAAHVRDRSARRRCVDLRAGARDRDLDRDDRPPLRAPGPGLLGLDQGAAGRQIESFWRFSGVRRRAVGHRRLAAIPHEDGDHGRWSVPGSNRRPPAVTFGLA